VKSAVRTSMHSSRCVTNHIANARKSFVGCRNGDMARWSACPVLAQVWSSKVRDFTSRITEVIPTKKRPKRSLLPARLAERNPPHLRNPRKVRRPRKPRRLRKSRQKKPAR